MFCYWTCLACRLTMILKPSLHQCMRWFFLQVLCGNVGNAAQFSIQLSGSVGSIIHLGVLRWHAFSVPWKWWMSYMIIGHGAWVCWICTESFLTHRCSTKSCSYSFTFICSIPDGLDGRLTLVVSILSILDITLQRTAYCLLVNANISSPSICG